MTTKKAAAPKAAKPKPEPEAPSEWETFARNLWEDVCLVNTQTPDDQAPFLHGILAAHSHTYTRLIGTTDHPEPADTTT